MPVPRTTDALCGQDVQEDMSISLSESESHVWWARRHLLPFGSGVRQRWEDLHSALRCSSSHVWCYLLPFGPDLWQ
jgi:hypothetical protein